jgi:hypothetical protein
VGDIGSRLAPTANENDDDEAFDPPTHPAAHREMMHNTAKVTRAAEARPLGAGVSHARNSVSR